MSGVDLSSEVDQWHTYQVWWSPDQIRVGVDGNAGNAHLVYSKRPDATNDDWPFDHPMDLILNLAIGGNMGGTIPTGFQYEMLVDYVRVYQGDWSATMEGEEAEPYVAAAEGVLALASDDYADQANTDWFPWGSAEYQGLVDGAHTYNNVDYIGIEPAAPIDLSGQDTVHLTIMRTNPDADLIFKLVNVNGDEGRLDIPAAWVEANEWVELTFPKSEFINLNTTEDVHQIVLASTISGAASNETLYVKELYMSDSTISGPAVDAETNMQDYKGVVALQGDESTVDVGTNFFSNGYASTVVSEVTLDGNEHVQKYENAGWIQITPETPVPVADLTTLHLSVFRTGGLHESWGSSEFRVKLVYDGAVEDNYTFSAPRGNEAVQDQWNNLEVPLSQLPGAQSGPDVSITDIILVTERWFEGSLSGETVYLDGLAFSEKVSPEVIFEAPPTPVDDAQDVIAVFSDTYTGLNEFDPLYRWSTRGRGGSGLGAPLRDDRG